MLVTFYLSGPYSASTVASEFTIVGNPGAETFPGVLKAQLLTGHSVTFSESVTGGTVTATDATCEGTVVNWYVTPPPTPTPIPATAECWTVTYTTTNPPPSDLYVRYRDNEGTVQTTLLTNIESLDLGNGSVLVGLCVSLTGAYNTPVWVQGGIEVTTEWLWSNEGTPCTTNGQCLIGN